MAAAQVPWIFTQQHPLNTDGFIRAAGDIGITTDLSLLRELWRFNLLAPLFEVRSRATAAGFEPILDIRTHGGSLLEQIRTSRREGRLEDPAIRGYRPQLRMARPSGEHRLNWWNGLIYSRWQLLALAELEPHLREGRRRWRDGRLRWQLRPADSFTMMRATWHRRLSSLLVALEARYMPEFDEYVLHLVNADRDQWREFRAGFSAASVLRLMGWTADEVLTAANNLLSGLGFINLLGNEWSQLFRRAPVKEQEDVSGALRRVLDRRLAAEILLKCYEDLAEEGLALPLSQRSGTDFSYASERISHRSNSLDQLLSGLGISPHPGVILLVEGESEAELLPRIQKWIRTESNGELVRPLILRGVTRDLSKLAAFACAPIVERPIENYWLTRRPPTRIMVLVDPERQYSTAAKVEHERQKLVDEIVTVVRAQGVDPTRGEVESLVQIHAWAASCFEFEHFTNRELAEALRAIHPTCGGLDDAALSRAVSIERSARRDIRRVWGTWVPEPSKIDLANALWPAMEARLEQASAGKGPWPPIAEKLAEAFAHAALRHRGLFALTGKPWPTT